jgi:hypothetical protein
MRFVDAAYAEERVFSRFQPHPEESQRFCVMIVGNDGKEGAVTIERSARIEREALVFEHKRLGDLLWKLKHPRDAVFL